MDNITKNGLKALAIDSWNGEGDLETFIAGFVAAWSERSTLANVTIEAQDKRIAELEAALHLLLGRAYMVSDQYSKTGYECRECSGWGIQKGEVEHYDWCNTGQANRIYIGSEE